MNLPRCTLLLALAAGGVHAADGPAWRGELRLSGWDTPVNARGPLADANRLAPGTAGVSTAQALAELEARAEGAGWVAEVWLASVAQPGGRSHAEARFNELALNGALGDWQWTLGRQRVAWDVGYGFRPNDLVGQEARRTLLSSATEGRPALQLERFWGADTALSLVWANPQHAGGGQRDATGADESALALRGYQRLGALDAYAFGRWGRHTGASLGAALAWVADDALELHASWRLLQRSDGWRIDAAAADRPLPANPWQVGPQAGSSQWLLGLSWTGSAQQSLLVETWHDGTAPADAAWDAWQRRNQALAAFATTPGLPEGLQQAAAGNLGWQASPLSGAGPRRQQLFVRAAWQPTPWTLSLDSLYHPADHGRTLTAAAQWQGDRWRLEAAWRVIGGPSSALLAQLPQRQQLVLAARVAL
ncbi:hypothetical protein KAK07_04930 [Ideonella sp. 4Y16]|uniref:Alginate export domain-containing protein n=1 Tax=Ideonella alba TaxID=2824118 RepID=A0A941BDE7_9BURK|nr:hypothetical protein [Ideonella alba]MBQ0932925.1 hypothetical protein [Ideonella alba]MBQ0942668.1 hypothetical protein [Ideonella alba]